MGQESNKRWIARLTAADAEQSTALSELRSILFARIQKAFRSNKHVDDAFVEDMVQEGLLAILDSLPRFEGRSQFETWCTTIVVRIAITELRRRRWKDVSLDEVLEAQALGSQLSSDGSPQEVELQKSQVVTTLRRLITEQLTEKQIAVLEAELKGMPQSEIAQRLGSTRNAIYKVGHDARKKLKQAMVEAGYSAEDLNIFTGATQ